MIRKNSEGDIYEEQNYLGSALRSPGQYYLGIQLSLDYPGLKDGSTDPYYAGTPLYYFDNSDACHDAFWQEKQAVSQGKKLEAGGAAFVVQLSYYLFETYGILYTNSTISGLVLAVVPVVTIGTGALFLKEYPTKRQALFCILPVAGVIIISIAGKSLQVSNLFLGGVFLLLTLLSSAIYKTANRKVAEEFSPFERTFLVLAVSAVAFSVIGLKLSNWDFLAYVAPLANIKYLAVVFFLELLCSIVANLLVNYAMSRMSVFKVASFGALSTLCSAVLGIFVMGDSVNINIIVGGVLILVGVRQVTKPK